MNAERDRKLNLSDPGRDPAGDEIESLLNEEIGGDDAPAEDAGSDSFLDRFPFTAVSRPEPDKPRDD